MKKSYKGELEVDDDRGVIYFHSKDQGKTMLRICRIPKEQTKKMNNADEALDITHMIGSYTG